MKYTEQVSNAIKSETRNHKERIASYKKIDPVLKLCKSLFPMDEDGNSLMGTPWLDGEINYLFSCKSMVTVKEILAKFAKNGVMLDNFIESDTRPIWYLKKDGVRIRICPYWSQAAEGASCRLVQVGEETIVRPKYKLICDKEVA
jgi:hypothetical protein